MTFFPFFSSFLICLGLLIHLLLGNFHPIVLFGSFSCMLILLCQFDFIVFFLYSCVGTLYMESVGKRQL